MFKVEEEETNLIRKSFMPMFMLLPVFLESLVLITKASGLKNKNKIKEFRVSQKKLMSVWGHHLFF